MGRKHSSFLQPTANSSSTPDTSSSKPKRVRKSDIKDLTTDVSFLKKDFEQAKKELEAVKDNQLKGLDLDQFIFNKFSIKLDPVFYIENVLRAHLPESRKHLHSNQIELVRAACNPRIRRVAGIMARQCFAKDTPVLMANGTVKLIQDIAIGDSVLTPSNTAATVIRTTSGIDKMYKIINQVNKQDSYIVNSIHNLALVAKNNTFKKITVEAFIKHYGYNSSNSPYSGYYHTIPNYPEYISLRFTPINLTFDPLITIPLDILRGNLHLRQQFIQNLKNVLVPTNNIYTIVTRDEEYKNRLMQLLASLSYHPQFYIQEEKFIISFQDNVSLIYNFVIKPLEYAEYYGITIDSPDHLFILGNGTVVSNSGKCFAPGTQIMLSDGTSKKVENINIGDSVMSISSTPTKVTALGHGQEEMYTIQPDDDINKSFTVNKSHILSLIKKDKTPQKINITVEQYLQLTDTQKSQLYGYRVPVTFNYFPPKINPYTLGLQLISTPIDLLLQLIKENILYNASNIRLQFLAGLLDSNKFKATNLNNSTIMLSFREERLTDIVLTIIQMLGFNGSKQCVDYIHQITFYGNFTTIPTKKFKIPKINIKRNPLEFQFKVIPKGVGQYYGFTIDSPNKLFLLKDCTVVHNTESIASFTGFLLDNYPNMRIGIFTPRIQQAEITIGRLSIFFQMNEERLNNRLIKCTKQKIELSNNSYVSAVSASDQSNIEGLTFDIAVLDEAQKISNYTFSERILPMQGSCGPGGQQLFCRSGKRITLKQVIKNKEQIEIASYDTSSKRVVTGKIIGYIEKGEHETIKFTLDSGLSIECTYDHKLLTWIRNDSPRHEDWIQAKDIVIGTRIGVPRIIPFYGSRHESNAYLLGLLIGDGSYSKHAQVHFGSYSDALWNHIKQYAMNIKYYRQFTTTENKNYRAARIAELTSIVKQAGIYGQAHDQKTLPTNWEEYNKESLQNLAAGLFDTDGNVFYPSNTDKQRPTISFSNICKKIIDDLQILLLKLGIRSKIQYRKAKPHTLPGGIIKETNDIYVLHICGKENIETFANNIPIKEEDKVANLNKIIQYFKSHKFKIDKSILNTDLRFEKVVKIEYSKDKVYDITVDKYHTYIANGIISHNCNGKLIQIGTPKTRNHFYDAVEGKESDQWYVVRKDWTECEQLWALASTELPDHNDPTHTAMRKYSSFVLSLMPKSLKQDYFPTRPDVWTEGAMSVEDFKTQYMLQFVDGASQFLTTEEVESLKSGEFDWITEGIYGETYVAGIDFASSTADTADYTHISILRVDRNTRQKQKVFAIELSGMSYPEQINVIDNLLGNKNPKFYCQAIFCDFTGCGRPVVQSLIEERGMKQVTGITFNATDTLWNTGMNFKNAMYAHAKQEIDYGRFKYPSLDRYSRCVPSDQIGFWHRQISEWSDLLCEQKISINKRIGAGPGAHDDVPSADILAISASLILERRSSNMPKPVIARLSR